mgnify:CR=1 FL=1
MVVKVSWVAWLMPQRVVELVMLKGGPWTGFGLSGGVVVEVLALIFDVWRWWICENWR